MEQFVRFLYATVLGLSGSLAVAPSVAGQSTFDALLAAVDTSNVYLVAGRHCLDSCRMAELNRRRTRQSTPDQQVPSVTSIRQNRRLTEQSFNLLRRKVHQQVRLTCINLIYQRKRQRELGQRQAQIRQVYQDLLMASLRKPETVFTPPLRSLLGEVTVKLSQKPDLIDQHQRELALLMGNRPIAFDDTNYPPLPVKKARLKRSERSTEFDEWRNRFVVLQQLMAVDSTADLTRKPYSLLQWEFRSGMVSADEFVYQLINRYQLTDAHMRTERDLHIAAAQLLSYAKKENR